MVEIQKSVPIVVVCDRVPGVHTQKPSIFKTERETNADVPQRASPNYKLHQVTLMIQIDNWPTLGRVAPQEGRFLPADEMARFTRHLFATAPHPPSSVPI